jgi:flagellar basal-body rod modification protein FlgD
MQSLSAVTGTTSGAPSSGGASSAGSNALGKDAFLKLLITQLRYQDPLNPLDQNQFLSQTAQFNSLEQLQSINKELASLSEARTQPDLGQAASLLGKTVQIADRDFQFAGASAPGLSFNLDGRATNVQITIFDEQGSAVRTLSTGGLDAGAHSVDWDGLDDSGQLMMPGTYTYRVVAAGTTDASAPTAWVDQGTVTGLRSQGGQVLYQVGNALVTQDDIVSVH